MVKKLRFLFITAGLFMILSMQAQSPSVDVFAWLQTRVPGQGMVQIRQDNIIRDMVNLHLAQQRSMKGIWGYKISIFRGSGQTTRKDAELTRSRFISKYENVECKLEFEYPNWKVYVGNFRTKSEALQFLHKISSEYPDEPFIREGIVSYPD
ncbi:MAG: hypothetical protein R6X09_09320 [Bacteroidales bacterium]